MTHPPIPVTFYLKATPGVPGFTVGSRVPTSLAPEQCRDLAVVASLGAQLPRLDRMRIGLLRPASAVKYLAEWYLYKWWTERGSTVQWPICIAWDTGNGRPKKKRIHIQRHRTWK